MKSEQGKNVIYEFRLSPPGSGRGVSCDANGVFIGSIPLLRRAKIHGRDRWEPRDNSDLSKQLSNRLGLPIDMSAKAGGIKAIANALNEGDVARAQIAAVLMGIPDRSPLTKGGRSRIEMVKFIRDLYWSGLIKADWDPDEHPRWPAGAPDRQGGEFAPKGRAAEIATVPSASTSRNQRTAENSLLQPVAAQVLARDVPGRRSEQECDEQYAADHAICGTLSTKRDKAICRASAAERYANCLRGKPMPPLTLPENDYAQPPESPEPARPRFPVRPPWWLPFLLLPLPAGIPA